MILTVCILLIITLITKSVSNEEIKIENGILILNKNNFESAINDYEYMFMKFYAPWCKHSQKLSPEYIKAAEEIAQLQLPVRLAEIDASEEKELCNKYDVFGFPTLKLFRRGTLIDYFGDRESEEIVSWLKEQVRPPAIELTTIDDAVRLIQTEDIVIIGFYKNPTSEEAAHFYKIADSFVKPTFATTFNEDIFAKYDAENGSIILFKNFDYPKVIFEEELSLDNLKAFVETESTPLIVELNNLTAEKVFTGKIKNFVLLFISKKIEDKVKNVLNLARPVAEQFKKHILFLSVDIDLEPHVPLLEYFDLKVEEVPAVGILTTQDNTARYKMEAQLTADNLKRFLQDFSDNKLSKLLQTEELPVDWNKTPIFTLVGSNFINVTKDAEKHAIVYFYTDSCEKCEIWEPVLEKVAEHYNMHDDVIIAKINVDANELDETPYQAVPAVILYRKGDKKHIEYEGGVTYEEVLQFMSASVEAVSNEKSNINNEKLNDEL